jgi:hypothetical protein
MFKNDSGEGTALTARWIGRTVFGGVLTAGALVLVSRLLSEEAPHAAAVIGATWSIAALFGLLATKWATLRGGYVRTALFEASVVLPSIGMALLTPLSLHLGVALVLGEGGHGFDGWAAMSMAAVGLAHVGFAILAAIRGLRAVRGATSPSLAFVYIVTIVLSLVPWGMFVLPPVIVGVTGIPIVLFMRLADGMIARERDAAARLPTVPRAVVV